MRTLAASSESFMTARARTDARYAVCLCPDPQGPAGRAAAEWLGRCAGRDLAVPQPYIPGMSTALFGTITQGPRQYGFNATLKAPFRMDATARRRDLSQALAAIAAEHVAFDLPAMQVRSLGDFLAIAPEEADARMDRLAAQCVMQLDEFRGATTGGEMRCPERNDLTARQQELLERWGDAFVMDEFHLHYSLTGPLALFDEGVAGRVAESAREHFAPVLRELRHVSRLVVFEERVPGAPLRIVETVPLAPRGRLLYVVGPSPCGHEQVVAWARQRQAHESRVIFAGRTITRPDRVFALADHSVDPHVFEEQRLEGRFGMHWEAEGHRYGVGREWLEAIDRGSTVVVAGWREHVPHVLRRYPDAIIVQVSADDAEAGGNLLLDAIVARTRPGY